jgi:cyclomaltodextrinase
VGNHDVTRLATVLKDPALVGPAIAVLLFVGGVPTLYYGDEQGFEGLKEERFGGDDAIRPAFPEQPADLPSAGWPIYHLHQQLISVRRRHPWLGTARTETLHLANDSLALAASDPDGDQRLVLLLNLADQPVAIPLTLSDVVVVEQSEGSAADQLQIGAKGWAVVRGH